MRTHTHHNTHKRTVRICDENNVPVKKSMHLITSPPKKRYITLKIKDYKKQVSFGEFQRIKALDKKKLISTRDATKAKIKDTETQYKNNKIVYEPEIMNKIAVLREKELRTTIYHMSKALQSKSQNLEEETLKLYEEILINIKKIFEKVSKEIEEKKIEILQRIQIRLNECDNRQRKLLEKKIAEQETILRNLHTFTYEMQRVRENYGIIKNKISNLSEKNFELEQRIKLEDQKYDKIYSLLREYKVRINNIAHTIEKYKKEEKGEKEEKEENEKVEDIQKENKLELKNLILNNIETEYTNNKVTTTNNNNKNKSLRPNSVKESMAFNLMNKSIKQFNNKINFYENLNYQEIPDNKLYNCLIKIIDTMKNFYLYKIKNLEKILWINYLIIMNYYKLLKKEKLNLLINLLINIYLINK